MEKNPLVSCVMVTKNPKRWEFLKRSILQFVQQTYQNKQLVIVCDDVKEYNDKIADFIKDKNNIKLSVVEYKEGDQPFSLGYLRNVSLDNSDGDYIMQWDDDDLYHESRIEAQMDALQKNSRDICLLQDLMLKLKDNEPIKIRYPLLENLPQGHPGTILFKRTDIRYKPVGKEEDKFFLADLLNNGYSYILIEGQHHLYTYCYQGENTFGYSHFLVLKNWQNKAINFKLSYK